jgi:hypothetical protein
MLVADEKGRNLERLLADSRTRFDLDSQTR